MAGCSVGFGVVRSRRACTGRLWTKARAAALTAEEVASPLARRPYDLRHAAVSTWLNGGVPAPQVAAWAGHSVDVLLRDYAKCIAGQGGRAPAAGRGSSAAGPFMIASVGAAKSRAELDRAGQTRRRPPTAYLLVGGRFRLVAGGR